MERLELYYKQMNDWQKKGYISERSQFIMRSFLDQYLRAIKSSGEPLEFALDTFSKYMKVLDYLFQHPFTFEPYHQMVIKPFNYYEFGMNFARPLINWAESEFLGEDNLKQIEKSILANENVILLANHQTEIDPQLMNLLLEKKFPQLAKDMIFVAGDRVISDHLAIPLSMGRNLLCIYSKKHINNPPEKKEQKRLHNKKTMQLMSELLAEGGKCIYVAPSGGRDRPDQNGEFNVAPFDPQSIEMFYLMTKRAKKVTHFHPLALLTYRVLPPPNDVEIELGEERYTDYAGVFASFGQNIDMENFPGHDHGNKINQRHNRNDYIWNLVKENYQELKKLKDQHEKLT